MLRSCRSICSPSTHCFLLNEFLLLFFAATNLSFTFWVLAEKWRSGGLGSDTDALVSDPAGVTSVPVGLVSDPVGLVSDTDAPGPEAVGLTS